MEKLFQEPPVNHHYVERPELTKAIQEGLDQPVKLLSPYRLAVLVGPGGSGKTHLAQNYLLKSVHRFEFLAQFNVTSLRHLMGQYHRFVKDKSIPVESMEDEDILKGVLEWFASRKTFIIFDNVECDLDDLETYIPHRGQHQILVTTRQTNWPNTIPVDRLTPEQSHKLISSTLKVKEAFHEVKKLGDTMHHIPLAITQAVAHINVNNHAGKKLTINEYLNRYAENKKSLFASNDRLPGLAHRHESIWITYEVALADILEKKPQVKDLLDLIGFFHPDHIPREVMKSWFKESLERGRLDAWDKLQTHLTHAYLFTAVFLPNFLIISQENIVDNFLLPISSVFLFGVGYPFYNYTVRKFKYNYTQKFYESSLSILEQYSLLKISGDRSKFQIHPVFSEIAYDGLSDPHGFSYDYFHVKFDSKKKLMLYECQRQIHYFYNTIKSSPHNNDKLMDIILYNSERLYSFNSKIGSKLARISYSENHGEFEFCVNTYFEYHFDPTITLLMDLIEIYLHRGEITVANGYFQEIIKITDYFNEQLSENASKPLSRSFTELRSNNIKKREQLMSRYFELREELGPELQNQVSIRFIQ